MKSYAKTLQGRQRSGKQLSAKDRLRIAENANREKWMSKVNEYYVNYTQYMNQLTSAANPIQEHNVEMQWDELLRRQMQEVTYYRSLVGDIENELARDIPEEGITPRWNDRFSVPFS